MSIEAHLAELTEKHKGLETRIHEELARPMADNLKVSELKRQKLRIKEQIERIQEEIGQHA